MLQVLPEPEAGRQVSGHAPGFLAVVRNQMHQNLTEIPPKFTSGAHSYAQYSLYERRMSTAGSLYTVKKAFRYSQPGCHFTNSPWAGIIMSYINYSRRGRVWQVTSRLGTEISKSFFTVQELYDGLNWGIEEPIRQRNNIFSCYSSAAIKKFSHCRF